LFDERFPAFITIAEGIQTEMAPVVAADYLGGLGFGFQNGKHGLDARLF